MEEIVSSVAWVDADVRAGDGGQGHPTGEPSDDELMLLLYLVYYLRYRLWPVGAFFFVLNDGRLLLR